MINMTQVLSPSYSQSLAVIDCHPIQAVDSKWFPKKNMHFGENIFSFILASRIGNPLTCNQFILMYASHGRLCKMPLLPADLADKKNEIRFWLGEPITTG
jgi:hypothetical protein